MWMSADNGNQVMPESAACSIVIKLLCMCAVLQVFLTIAILMGEGMYMVGRVLLSSEW